MTEAARAVTSSPPHRSKVKNTFQVIDNTEKCWFDNCTEEPHEKRPVKAASPDDVQELKSDENIILVNVRHRIFMSMQSVKSVNLTTIFENKRNWPERVFKIIMNANDNP